MTKTLALLCLICCFGKIQAQVNEQIWLDYNASYFLSKKSSLRGSQSYRIQTNNANWQQSVTAVRYRYALDNTFNLNAGIHYFSRFGSEVLNQNEIRTFQGIQARFPEFNKVDFRHYVRIEQRFLQNSGHLDQIRLRYQLVFSLDLVNTPKHIVTIPIALELFFDTSKDKDDLLLKERERLFTGISYQKAQKWKVEFNTAVQGVNDPLATQASDLIFRFRFFHFIKTSTDYQNEQ